MVRKLFPTTTWESYVDKVLLTFDDGPTPKTTPLILNKLSEHSIKAIFFCVGNNIEKYPELARQIISEGHLIGNHTMYHRNIIFTPNATLPIALCSNEIENAIGSNPIYFRPPHGKIGLRTEKLMKENNLKNVMWSLLTYDYKNDMNIVKFTINRFLRKNSIVVLHDSIKSKSIIADSIDYIVDRVNVSGFEFGEPLECLK